jgi:hypothetical protein
MPLYTGLWPYNETLAPGCCVISAKYRALYFRE